MAKKSRPPKSGKVVITTKAGTALWLIIFGTFFGLLGVCLLIFGAVGLNVLAVIFAILLLCIAGTAGGGAYYFGVLRPRLVVTDDALKLIHGKSVVGYIPLDNIETADVGEEIHEWVDDLGSHRRVDAFVYLVLYDRKDRDTDWPKWEKKRRFDIEIKDDFEESSQWICDLLQQRMQPYKEERREKNSKRRRQEFD